MLSVKLDEIEILEAINQLKGSKGNKYDVNLVRSEFQKPIKLFKGTWIPEKNERKRILLISSGPKLNEYKQEIEKYINKKKPIVIALNTFVKIKKKELIDFYLACNPLRLIADAKLYKSIKSPLIVPKDLLSDFHIQKFKKLKLLNFGIGIKDN